MAVPTITPVSTLISNADSSTNWTGGSLDTDSKVQGTGCIGKKVSNATTNFVYDASGHASAPFDFSSGGAFEGQHIYVWLNCLTPTLDTLANGGLRIYVGNGTSAGVWYVGGQGENYTGGWKNFVVDPARDFDAIVAGSWTTAGNPAQLSAVTQFGGTVKTTATIMGNFNNGLVDAIRVGTGIRITDGDATTPATWAEIVAADDGTFANKYGVVREQSGVVFVQGTVEIGHNTGATTTLFEDQGQIISFEDAFVADNFYGIRFQGNTIVTYGTSSGEGDSQIAISGLVTTTGTTSSKPSFETSGSSITDYNLFAFNSILASSVSLGGINEPITGSTINLLDNVFDQSQLITLNVSSSGATMKRNRSVNSLAGTVSGSILLINPKTIDGNEWSVVLGNGFSSLDDSVTETYTIRNHDFTTNTQYLKVFSNKTWDIINPTGFNVVTTGQTELNFLTATGNQVNEKYSIDILTQDAAGTAISASAVYVYEGLLNQDLPTANQMYTDTFGTSSSDIQKVKYTDDGAGGLTTVTNGSFALKAYRYGRNPFEASITANAAINQTITFLVDTNISASFAVDAIANGSTSITPIKHGTGETDIRPLKVFHFDGGAGTAPSAGQVISGSTSGGQGSLLELRYGDATSGILVLSGWNGTEFTNNETIGNSFGWSALADTSADAQSFYEEYTWEYQMNGATHQIVYDYDRARTSEDPTTALAIYKTSIIWGEAEQTNMIYSDGTNYFTERNVNLLEGVWLANPSDAGVVKYMTSDAGTQFIPPQTYSFVLTGLQLLSEVRIYNADTGVEISGVENSGTSFTYNYTYSGSDTNIYVVIFSLTYKDIRLTNLVLSNTDQSIPIQQQTDRVYSNPA